MAHLHQRIFLFSAFEGDLPMFKNREEEREFQAAIGRMVLYSLHNRLEEDVVSLVTAHVSKRGEEVLGAFHAPWVAQEKDKDGYRWYSGSKAQKLEVLLQDFTGEGRPFVMGAVRNEDGTYGFHS